MKKTAVEWLVEQLNEKIDFIPLDKWDVIRDIVQQAKAMEKEQIEDAFQAGKWDWNEHITNGEPSKDLAQYYNETFTR
jgi:hypothetical protein